MNNLLNIALVKPPLSGHQFRGIGHYTQHLFKELKKQPEIRIDLINLDVDTFPYDLIHYPYFDPFFLTLPVGKSKPTIVTVHDLISLKYPRFFERGIKGELKWQIQRLSLKSASLIVTDSQASKEDIILFTGIDKDQIQVIYLGVDNEFKKIKDKKKLEKTAYKFHLPKKFILHVGDVNYNKNISGLVKAFSLINKNNPDLYMVLVGKGFEVDSLPLRNLKALITILNLENKVVRLSYIDKKELVDIYSLATIYVQPSFAEGFGLPVLEAMACGLPVIASSISSLPEIVGDAGILVDPENVAQIAKSISSLYSDSRKKEILVKKGFERIKMFTWEKCARETLKIYQQAL